MPLSLTLPVNLQNAKEVVNLGLNFCVAVWPWTRPFPFLGFLLTCQTYTRTISKILSPSGILQFEQIYLNCSILFPTDTLCFPSQTHHTVISPPLLETDVCPWHHQWMSPEKTTGYSLSSLRPTPRRYLRNIKQKLFICITFNKLEGMGSGEEKATNICWEPTISGIFHPVLRLERSANSQPPSVFQHLLMLEA